MKILGIFTCPNRGHLILLTFFVASLIRCPLLDLIELEYVNFVDLFHSKLTIIFRFTLILSKEIFVLLKETSFKSLIGRQHFPFYFHCPDISSTIQEFGERTPTVLW